MLQSLFGFLILLLLARLIGDKQYGINLRTVIGGILVTWLIAIVLLKSSLVQDLFIALNGMMLGLSRATEAGTSFVFGFLGGAPLPFEESQPGASFILAFRALPLVMVISALSALLYYWRILPWVVKAFSWFLSRTMQVSGATGVGAAANVFIGMVEAPLLVKPYLKRMSRAELFSLMVCGMATIAGTMMVLYATILGQVIPNAMGHILTASLISAPAALVVASLMVPAGQNSAEDFSIEPSTARSSMDAITRGTFDGLQLFLNIIAMLIVLVALVDLLNQVLSWLPQWGDEPLTLQRILGYVFAPLVWLAGVPWSESLVAGSIMGSKTVLNEFIAYLALIETTELSERSRLIMTYALCGFANFGSLGIMVGGLSVLAPERRSEIVALGMKSIVAGTLTTLLTAAVVGVLA